MIHIVAHVYSCDNYMEYGYILGNGKRRILLITTNTPHTVLRTGW